jgi:hypothetical protein
MTLPNNSFLCSIYYYEAATKQKEIQYRETDQKMYLFGYFGFLSGLASSVWLNKGVIHLRR